MSEIIAPAKQNSEEKGRVRAKNSSSATSLHHGFGEHVAMKQLVLQSPAEKRTEGRKVGCAEWVMPFPAIAGGGIPIG